MKVILAADDAGISPGITETIFDAAAKSPLSCVSVVATGSDFVGAIIELKKRPNLMVSLHLNLFEGKSLSRPKDIPHLVNREGVFNNSFGSLLFASMVGGTRRVALGKELQIEIGAQLRHMRSALGETRPIGIDGHRHVQMIPIVALSIASFATEYSFLRFRLVRELPLWRQLKFFRFLNPLNILKHYVLKLLAYRIRPILLKQKIPHNDFFVGVLFSDAMRADIVRYNLGLMRAYYPQSTVEVLFHPGGEVDPTRLDPSTPSLFTAFYRSAHRLREAEELKKLNNEDFLS